MKQLFRKIFSSKSVIGVFERLSGTKVLTNPPLGFSPILDLKYYINTHLWKKFIIFDVGANIGQTALVYRKEFPQAEIHSFEPVKSTFQELSVNTASKNIFCHNLALGGISEYKKIHIYNSSDYNSFLLTEKDHASASTEMVTMLTFDDFCLDKNISAVNYLKVDTEGYDLEVLKGATNSLTQHKIDFVETEISLNPTNTSHVDLHAMINYMNGFDYLLFGIYEQHFDYVLKKPVLRRGNLVFISPVIYNDKTMYD